MADPSCSGTTPFKQLVDHQGRDASLHQDRLLNGIRPQGRESFRSMSQQPGQAPNGFSQFMNGALTGPGLGPASFAAGRVASHASALAGAQVPQPHGPMAHGQQMPGAPQVPFPQPHGPMAHGTPLGLGQHQGRSFGDAELNAWAAQYQEWNAKAAQNAASSLRGEAAAFVPTQTRTRPAPYIPLTGAPQMNAPFAANQQMAFADVQQHAPLYGPTNGSYVTPAAAITQREEAEAEFDREMAAWMGVHGPTAEARATEVMENIADEIEAEKSQEAKETEESLAAKEAADVTDTATTQRTPFIPPELANISNLRIDVEENKENWDPKDAAELDDEVLAKKRSDVAEAASDLLKSVRHEQGEKWKKSRFLELMSDFADGKKDIVDNEIRDVDGAGTGPFVSSDSSPAIKSDHVESSPAPAN